MFSIIGITNYHKLSGLKKKTTALLSYSFVLQKSNIGLIGLISRW